MTILCHVRVCNWLKVLNSKRVQLKVSISTKGQAAERRQTVFERSVLAAH